MVRATEKALRSPELAEIAKTELRHGELERIEAALAALREALGASIPRRFSARRSCSTTQRTISQKCC